MSLDTFQACIDAVSAALMDNDFESYRRWVECPLVLLTDAGTTLIDTEEAFRFGFDSYAGMLRTERATDLIRLAHSVTSYGPNLMTGRYETHILRGGQRLYGPFQSSMSLRRVGNDWKIGSVVSPTHAEQWLINRVRPAGRKDPTHVPPQADRPFARI